MTQKIILILAFSLTCSSAFAAWTKVTSNEEAIIYAEDSTAHKVGSIVRMSDLMDIKKPRVGEKYLSIKSSREYDCKLNKSRAIAYTVHSGNMGSGKLINSNIRVHDWIPVELGGATAVLWKVACGKH